MSLTPDQLKEMMRGVIKEELKQNPKTDTPIDYVDHVCKCPDCYCGLIKKAKEFPYQCSDCGLPLPKSMVGKENSVLEDSNPKPCPNCGSHEAEPIEREES